MQMYRSRFLSFCLLLKDAAAALWRMCMVCCAVPLTMVRWCAAHPEVVVKKNFLKKKCHSVMTFLIRLIVSVLRVAVTPKSVMEVS